ncbi:hypothetical protein kuro4_16610 [Gelria sp. Kuro-4]|nr:hypothetical protein kuro4_16610 [Gelria sp. Kuro-4]
MTLSGGEPLMQPSFALELLKAARSEGLHTALETSGYGSWKHLERMARYLDLVLLDIKHMDSTEHQLLTGKGNEVVLENARRLAEVGLEVVLRLPVIPTMNDSKENLTALGAFAQSLGIKRIDILPFHQLGESKYARLGKRYRLKGKAALEKKQVLPAKQLLSNFVPEVTIGGA